jgi:hypothetical protein
MKIILEFCLLGGWVDILLSMPRNVGLTTSKKKVEKFTKTEMIFGNVIRMVRFGSLFKVFRASYVSGTR